MFLLKDLNDQWLAGELGRRLGGKTLTVEEIKTFVLTETPCYLFKGALKMLESAKTVVPVGASPGRRPGTYPDEHVGLRLRFETPLFAA